jgi:hypothetical protein
MADEVDKLNIIIEGNQATWEINAIGDVGGTYIGTFKFKCLILPTQRLAASREYRALLGENPTLALAHDDNLAYALTQLKYRVISAPPFWTSTIQNNGMAGDLPDENIVMMVLDAAVEAELKYKQQLKNKKSEALEKAKNAAERLLKLQDEEPQDEGESEEGSD